MSTGKQIDQATPPGVSLDERKSRVVQLLRESPRGLFALLDGARNPMVYALAVEHPDRCASLYEGLEGERLVNLAPYVWEVPRDEELLETLVGMGWGESWGYYLTSDATLDELRAHFRQFVTAMLPDGTEVYFRFYDPRVLRVYLPTCDDEEVGRFLGPVESLLVEDESGDNLLAYTRDHSVEPAVTPLPSG